MQASRRRRSASGSHSSGPSGLPGGSSASAGTCAAFRLEYTVCTPTVAPCARAENAAGARLAVRVAAPRGGAERFSNGGCPRMDLVTVRSRAKALHTRQKTTYEASRLPRGGERHAPADVSSACKRGLPPYRSRYCLFARESPAHAAKDDEQ